MKGKCEPFNFCLNGSEVRAGGTGARLRFGGPVEDGPTFGEAGLDRTPFEKSIILSSS